MQEQTCPVGVRASGLCLRRAAGTSLEVKLDNAKPSVKCDYKTSKMQDRTEFANGVYLPSFVDSVRVSLESQQQLDCRNTELPQEARLQ